MSSKADVINDASFTTEEDDTNNIVNTLWDAEEQTDGMAYDDNNNSSYETLPAKKPPTATTAGTKSTYYASFHQSGTEEHNNINNTTFVNQQPSLSTTTSKRAANEYEQLLSSTIFSLLEKFVPALQKQRLSPSKNNECSSDEGLMRQSSSLDIPAGGDNYSQSTAFNIAEEFENSNSNDRMALLDVESQSFEINNNNPPYSNNEMKTPKVNNLKTTGLEEEEEFDDTFQQQQRKDSTSSSEYLPQSAAKLLNTLQHTNFDRGAEEIMLSILSSNSGSSLDGSGSSSFSFNEDDHQEGDDDDDGDNKEGKAAVNAAKLPPPVTNNDQDGTIITKNRHNSFESSSSNQQQQQYNYDDDFDDTSLSGDMARLSTSIAHLQRDLENIDMAQFETICLDDEDDDQQHDMYGGRGNRWKHWIRKWLLSHGIVNDEKVLNQLLLSGTTNNGENDGSSNITPGRGGFSIFDFERDYMFVLVLLLVFFVLLRNRFQTVNELLLFEDDNQDLLGGSSDW